MTKKSLKKSQGKSATPVTGAGPSTKSTTKEKLSLPTLKVLNDRVLIKPEKETNIEGGSKEVLDALKTGKLILPDEYEAAYFKRPQWGTIVSWGDKCKYKWEVGQKVAFPRDGWAKLKHGEIEYLIFAEEQLNATLD